jgi:hypothetical protein
MQKRLLLLFGTTAILLVGIVGVLGFAHAFARIEEGKRCFAGLMHAQWPKWVGCAMAAHENLAGGLIAGAGALIAALIAADAVWQQIQDARSQVAIAEQRRQYLESFSLVRALHYYSGLIHFFEVAEGPYHLKYINGLDAIYKSGNLVPFFGSLPAEHQNLTRDAWERLSNLNNALTRSRESSTDDAASTSAINAGLGDVLADLLSYRRFVQKRLAEMGHPQPAARNEAGEQAAK